jgi:hypothetical protein
MAIGSSDCILDNVLLVENSARRLHIVLVVAERLKMFLSFSKIVKSFFQPQYGEVKACRYFNPSHFVMF